MKRLVKSVKITANVPKGKKRKEAILREEFEKAFRRRFTKDDNICDRTSE